MITTKTISLTPTQKAPGHDCCSPSLPGPQHSWQGQALAGLGQPPVQGEQGVFSLPGTFLLAAQINTGLLSSFPSPAAPARNATVIQGLLGTAQGWGWRDLGDGEISCLERQDLHQVWCPGFPFGLPRKSLNLPPDPPENLNVFCHSKVITGNIFPEEEEREQEQTSQKVGFFLLYNQL